MVITKIEPSSGKKYKVYLNDEFAFYLYKSELKIFSLKEGQELDEKIYKKITEEILTKRAKRRALYLLEKRDLTEYELQKKLEADKYKEDVIKEAVAYVKGFCYINDEAYAKRYVEYKGRTKSRRQIEAELYKRGVDREIIEQVIGGKEGGETELIEKLILKKCGDPSQMTEKEQQKIYQYLLRKGFTFEDISSSLHKVTTMHLT